MRSFAVIYATFMFWASLGFAQEAVFPIACQPGQNCFIISYADISGGNEPATDYMCGHFAKKGDSALRIGMSSVEALRVPVNVLATRAGTVTEAVDGNKDLIITERKQLRRGASLCGNGVVIDHGRGLQTAYCHLRHGSVRVKAGDIVSAGDVIGHVGQSGLATWPQLGFSVQYAGVMLDPITAASAFEGCGLKPRPVIPLPDDFLIYNPASILNLGFSEKEEDLGSILTGAAQNAPTLDSEADILNFWAIIMGVEAGDVISVTLYDTRGRPFDEQLITAQTTEMHTPINITRKRGTTPWRAGVYTADISLTRTIKGRDYSVKRRATTVVKKAP